MLIKYIFFKSKHSEINEIMICGIHYFTTKLKTNIDVIPRGRFKYISRIFNHKSTRANTQYLQCEGNFLDTAKNDNSI